MRNGHLKPDCNINVATSNEFIIGTCISADRRDVQTLIPFMARLKKTYEGYRIGKTVADSEYESEENYCWFEGNPETELFVKPSNHEIRKEKKRNIARILVAAKTRFAIRTLIHTHAPMEN